MTLSPLIDADTLARLLEEDAATAIDCGFDLADPAAGRAAFQAARLPGARYLHLDEDLSGRPDGSNGRHPLPDPAALPAALRREGVDRGRRIVAYDASGGAFAARLWWLLRWIGHEAVAVLDGGRQAWTRAGHPLATGAPPAVAPGDFAAGPARPAMIADAAEIVASLAGRELLVVDARSPARFRGDANPLDPVPGRIPHARNRCYMDNLAADGRFKSAPALAADYDAVLGDVPPARTVLQCGSGVTACHDLLAMAIAGRDGARLYPGSWSEWTSDPARPVERDL